MKEFVFDAEGDGLLKEVTVIWYVSITDVNTGERWKYLPGDLGFLDKLCEADVIAGHNIMDYDFGAFLKLYGFKIPPHIILRDTLLFSQILDYRRFGHRGHSLEVWGEYLGIPKVEHEDWSRFSPEMAVRCDTDVDINVEVYKILMKEFQDMGAPETLGYFIRAEHYATWWSTLGTLAGWPFNRELGEKLHAEMTEKLAYATNQIEHKLGYVTVAVDKAKGEYPFKEPKWTKEGKYNHHTASWFNIDPWEGHPDFDRPIIGKYSRIKVRPLKLSSSDDVKTFLFRNGWVPDEYNTKKDPETGEYIQTSPKITESSLELLGGDGKLYTEYLSIKSRYGTLSTWLEELDANNNLHGECMIVGTPSMRARHSLIVNVPSTDALYGREMRSLFVALPGWKMIGCDSKGNQARGLAYYLNNPAFTEAIVNGDIHSDNAKILTEVLRSMGIQFEVPRGSAKRILYAFLFGASGGKLWSYIFGEIDKQQGNTLKNGFVKAVPGFDDLLKMLKATFSKTKKEGYGYILSLVGNKIYVDSYHKLLVYLLQSLEKITCSTALMLTMREFEKRGIPYIPCIYYHDEIDFQVPEEYAEEAAKIGQEAFKRGPQMYGINIMDGDSKIGNSWLEVH